MLVNLKDLHQSFKWENHIEEGFATYQLQQLYLGPARN